MQCASWWHVMGAFKCGDSFRIYVAIAIIVKVGHLFSTFSAKLYRFVECRIWVHVFVDMRKSIFRSSAKRCPQSSLDNGFCTDCLKWCHLCSITQWFIKCFCVQSINLILHSGSSCIRFRHYGLLRSEIALIFKSYPTKNLKKSRDNHQTSHSPNRD